MKDFLSIIVYFKPTYNSNKILLTINVHPNYLYSASIISHSEYFFMSYFSFYSYYLFLVSFIIYKLFNYCYISSIFGEKTIFSLRFRV